MSKDSNVQWGCTLLILTRAANSIESVNCGEGARGDQRVESFLFSKDGIKNLNQYLIIHVFSVIIALDNSS